MTIYSSLLSVDHGEFDDIVVGSGFCALAYIDTALKRDPNRKILVLERGGEAGFGYTNLSDYLIFKDSGFRSTSRSVAFHYLLVTHSKTITESSSSFQACSWRPFGDLSVAIEFQHVQQRAQG